VSGQYLDELTLLMDFPPDRVLNVSADLLLHHVVLLLDPLDAHQTVLRRLVEGRTLLREQPLAQVVAHQKIGNKSVKQHPFHIQLHIPNNL
jgi:hypothetical protein